MNPMQTTMQLSGLKRPPLRYYGSKWRIAPWVISHFPEHLCYCEVFGGGAGVLLRKARSKIEVYNDLDGQVVNFWRVLRDDAQRDKLIWGIQCTPFSRDEFEAAYQPAVEPVEMARRFVTRLYFGHGTCGINPDDSNGFRSCDNKAGKSYAREWAGIPEAIAAAAERMRGVTIENLDFRKVIGKYDHVGTLFYVDPPYPMDTRAAGGKGYVHEMADSYHATLAWMLKAVKGKVVVSGYSCRLYEEAFQGWRRADKKTTANGQVGAVQRVETIWMNF